MNRDTETLRKVGSRVRLVRLLKFLINTSTINLQHSSEWLDSQNEWDCVVVAYFMWLACQAYYNGKNIFNAWRERTWFHVTENSDQGARISNSRVMVTDAFSGDS